MRSPLPSRGWWQRSILPDMQAFPISPAKRFLQKRKKKNSKIVKAFDLFIVAMTMTSFFNMEKGLDLTSDQRKIIFIWFPVFSSFTLIVYVVLQYSRCHTYYAISTNNTWSCATNQKKNKKTWACAQWSDLESSFLQYLTHNAVLIVEVAHSWKEQNFQIHSIICTYS